jgi:signal transduction histidine kinase
MHEAPPPYHPYMQSSASNTTSSRATRTFWGPRSTARARDASHTARRDEAISSTDSPPLNAQRIAALRVLLALAVLWSTLSSQLDVTQPLLALVGLYVGVCVVAFVANRRTLEGSLGLDSRLPALDVLVFTSLIIARGPFNGVDLCGLFFAVVAVSMGAGARMGDAVAAFAATASLGRLAVQPAVFDLRSAEVLASAAVIFAIGTVLARWADAESKRNRMAAFVSELGEIAQSQPSEERKTRLVAESVRNLFDADGCLLLLSEPTGTQHALCKRKRAREAKTATSEYLDPILAERLLTAAGNHVLAYGPPARLSLVRRAIPETLVIDPCQMRTVARTSCDIEVIASLLDASAVLSAPVTSSLGAYGRLYVFWTASRPVDDSIVTLVKAASLLSNILDSIRVSDQLSSAAAAQERTRIARDLHDTTIQSFIGLQIGLTAVRNKLEAGVVNVTDEISKLLTLTEMEIGDMRGYVESLRHADENCPAFLPAVNRFVEKFGSVTGIVVEVIVEGDLALSGHFAAEAFQMVAEGLSNVRRHTQSSWARVHLSRANGVFVLEVENETPRTSKASFTPRSIGERTAALGGSLHVECGRDGTTCVRVCIPV